VRRRDSASLAQGLREHSDSERWDESLQLQPLWKRNPLPSSQFLKMYA